MEYICTFIYVRGLHHKYVYRRTAELRKLLPIGKSSHHALLASFRLHFIGAENFWQNMQNCKHWGKMRTWYSLASLGVRLYFKRARRANSLMFTQEVWRRLGVELTPQCQTPSAPVSMSPVPATISGRGETQSFHNIQTSVLNSGIELATKCQLKKIQAKRLFWRCHCKVSFVLWDPVEVLVSILSART